MLRAAIVSEDGAYRYRLDRRWGDGPRVVWVMLNPSTADAEVDDPTIRRCIAFSRAWGYDGMTVVNLHPLRTADPRVLVDALPEERIDNRATEACQRNLEEIDRAFDEATLVVAGWGAQRSDRISTSRHRLVERYHDRLHCLGLTRLGEPRHPLYLPGDRVPIPWDAPRA